MKSSSTVSSRESRAYALLFIIFSVINIFGPDLIDMIWPPQVIELKVDTILSTQKGTNDSLQVSYDIGPFDINEVDREQLIGMGLRKKTADTWIKYRKAVGGFESIEQIRDIYGLREETLHRIEPFAYISNTRLEDTEPSRKSQDKALELDTIKEKITPTYNKNTYVSKTTLDTIDLNSATKEELKSLYGVGPVFSERMLKFRDALGGFHSIEQVAETYGLPPETFQSIRDQLIIEGDWKKLDINHSEVEQLGAHPYISWEFARMIVRYREQNGLFKSVEELLKLHGIKKEEYQKIRPYLEVSDEINQVIIEAQDAES